MEETPSVASRPSASQTSAMEQVPRIPSEAPSVVLQAHMALPETPTSAEEEEDTALEYESMVLLSHLEQSAIRLSDPMMQASPALALEYLVNVTNRLVEFTERLPMPGRQKFSLEALIVRDRQNYERLGFDYIHNGRLVFAAFEKLHVSQGGMRHSSTFPQLSKDLLRVTNICLNLCVKAFHTPTHRQQWRTVYSGFLVNLARSLQKIAPLPPGS
ncbi:MAG: hypothetical protein FJZ47_20475 [Candidatus Tectomicrobia bacterium]|uniref:Uncharacterized protein n=1 Tax=Tectimicrobiota bacterium TaxID=2528274 RepID=A0A937W6N1_UNCTE|nr:hypothetical protein [Candidatus Tectomicrobia bacterium]